MSPKNTTTLCCLIGYQTNYVAIRPTNYVAIDPNSLKRLATALGNINYLFVFNLRRFSKNTWISFEKSLPSFLGSALFESSFTEFSLLSSLSIRFGSLFTGLPPRHRSYQLIRSDFLSLPWFYLIWNYDINRTVRLRACVPLTLIICNLIFYSDL